MLVVNAGSSSLKLRLLDDGDALVGSADLAANADGFDSDSVRDRLADWPRPEVVGHRIVHGGTRFTGPVRIDSSVTQRLRELTDLAPLHQPKSLAGLDVVGALLPDVPAVACFDTAFHTTIAPAAATYAVPESWRERYGVRRYGFHGLSHAYASTRARQMLGRSKASFRLVTCHLGAGASLCAVRDGLSVDTTMGFTPLEGLVMATRSGSVDPGLVLWLEEHERLSPREVGFALEHHSGLLALAGTSDMREVEARAAQGEPGAVLALDVYVHRLVTSIAAMAAATGGIDALVFTGGVGEHSATLRRSTAARLSWLGVAVDADRNDQATGDADLTDEAATVSVLVVAAREDLQMAHEIRGLLA